MAVPLAAVRFNEILIPECLGRRLCFAVQFLERGSQGSAVSLRPRSCSLSSTNKLGMSVLLPSESKQLFSWVNTPLSLSLSLLPLSQPHTRKSTESLYMCVADRQLKLRQRSDLKIFTCFFKGSVHTAHIFLFLPLMVFSHVDVLEPKFGDTCSSAAATQRSRTCYCVAQTAERWHLTDSIRTCLSRTNVPVTLEDHPQNLTNNSHWDYFLLRK